MNLSMESARRKKIQWHVEESRQCHFCGSYKIRQLISTWISFVKILSFQHSSATTVAESRCIYRELRQPAHDF
jgi:predicted nucleic-acid-binding Zn-ribbon protein